MASKKKSNNLKMRGYRTHRYLRFKVNHTGDGEDNHYIDIGRSLSALNRRLYKQGMIYNVSNIAVHDAQSELQFEFGTLRDSWPTYSAYRQARRIWKRQHYGTGQNVGAWTQFVVGLNRDMITDADNLIALSQEEWTVMRGEWLASCLTYTLPAAAGDENDAALVMLGASNAAAPTVSGSVNSGQDTTADGAGYKSAGCAFVKNLGQGDSTSLSSQQFTGTLGIMAEYGYMKEDVSETPNETSSSSSVFRQLDQMASGYAGGINDAPAIVGRVDTHGDHPPYAQNITGLEGTGGNADTNVVREARFASGQKTLMIPGFDVPLGLIQVVTTHTSDATGYIDVELSPGRYKGVAALEI